MSSTMMSIFGRTGGVDDKVLLVCVFSRRTASSIHMGQYPKQIQQYFVKKEIEHLDYEYKDRGVRVLYLLLYVDLIM